MTTRKSPDKTADLMEALKQLSKRVVTLEGSISTHIAEGVEVRTDIAAIKSDLKHVTATVNDINELLVKGNGISGKVSALAVRNDATDKAFYECRAVCAKRWWWLLGTMGTAMVGAVGGLIYFLIEHFAEKH